jgi:hypothetical protein
MDWDRVGRENRAWRAARQELRPQRCQIPCLVQHAGNRLTPVRLDNARYPVTDELVVVDAHGLKRYRGHLKLSPSRGRPRMVGTIAGMSDSIFLVGDDGSLTEASSAAYDAEAELQKLLAGNPQLLPGAQIDRDNPRRWLLVKREAGIPDREGGASWWSIDHLLVDQDAVPTFVEVKRASDARSRREVVAQMLDYAANGSVFWTPARLRGWFEADDPDGATGRLLDMLGPSADDPDAAVEQYWQMVGANLKEGRIRLVFVADEIPASLQRLVEFLNEQMPSVEVLAVEIRQYRAEGSKSGAVVPRLIGQTSRAQAAKAQTVTTASRVTPWTAEEVLQTVTEGAGADAADVARAVITWAVSHPHIQVSGGTGISYPSITMSADSGRAASRYRGVLSLYGSPNGERPFLEIRVKRMCSTPPYLRAEGQQRLIADLRALAIPRLDDEPALADKRPNIPLDQLTSGRIKGLLSVVDQWISDVRAHATDPEPA